MLGVVDFVFYKDVQGYNNWGIFVDEEIFVKEKVSYLKWKFLCINFYYLQRERQSILRFDFVLCLGVVYGISNRSCGCRYLSLCLEGC